ncbi:S49 family peptidase [Planctomycetota bacterium]
MFTFELTSPWAITPDQYTRFSQQAKEFARSRPRFVASETTPFFHKTADGVAVVAVSGILVKTDHQAQVLRSWGIESTSYQRIRDAAEVALGDNSINRIHLAIASPGGMVAGVGETVAALFEARETKPVTATIEDLCASGAYWLASQAEQLTANATAEIGGIGVFTVYHDSSVRSKSMGIDVKVIRSGEHKGMGVPGAPITDRQIEAVQENVDAIAGHFQADVVRGRNWSSFDHDLGSGRTWLAPRAMELGLIDGID